MRFVAAASLSLFVLMAVPAIVQAQSTADLFRQGNAAKAAGDYIGAEAIWRQVLLREPDNADAHYNLGLALASQGDYKAAIASYQRALELDPNLVTTQNNLAEAQRMLELDNAPVPTR